LLPYHRIHYGSIDARLRAIVGGSESDLICRVATVNIKINRAHGEVGHCDGSIATERIDITVVHRVGGTIAPRPGSVIDGKSGTRRAVIGVFEIRQNPEGQPAAGTIAGVKIPE